MAGLTRLLAIGQLVLLAATWKLWTPQTDFPQIPLIRAACDWPGWVDWVCLGILIASSIVLLIVARRGCISRAASAGIAISLAVFFVLDQHRLQPWAWQFFLLAILRSLADDTTARRGWMWLAISIYFWSGVSKLDYTFCHEQGPALLGGLKQAMGMRGMPNRWTETIDIVGSFCFALGELGVAVLLAWPRTRWLGLWTATIMHATLLVALGPQGLNHSHGVLLWNVFFIAQDWMLFRTFRITPTPGATSATGTRWQRLRSRMEWPRHFRVRAALVTIIAAMLWPLLEPVGLCDHWLAWAVYSARPGQVEVVAHLDMDIKKLPMQTQEIWAEFAWPLGYALHPVVYHTLNVSQWSLDKLAVPNYPQSRFQVGVAMFLVDHFDFQGTVVLWKPRNRWTGKPVSNTAVFVGRGTIGELETLADSFFWNVRPRKMANP